MPARRSGRALRNDAVRKVLVGVVVVGLAAQGLAATSAALFTATKSVANQFAAADCFGAPGTSVQGGTTTSAANGTVSVSISTVEADRSFLLFTARSNSNRPVGSTVRGRLRDDGAAVEFVRVTNESTPATIAIEWSVVTYGCGVRVQRGEVAQGQTTTNVPIAAVGGLGQAFVLLSKTPASTDSSWGEDDQVLGELTSTTNLQLRSNAASGHTIAWQVVEFEEAAAIAVQKGSTSLLGASLTTTVTLPTAVDPSRTFVLVGYRTAGAGTDIGARLLRARLTSSTQIVIDRSTAGSPDDITEIVWQAIELKDGSTVQHGTAAFPIGVAQQSVTISSVRLDRATGFASVQGAPGQSGGRADYVYQSFSETYAAATGGTSWQVPAGVTAVTVKAWGGGGGGGGGGGRPGGAGGGAGQAAATLAVTPGETLTLRVGGGGGGGTYVSGGGGVGTGGGGGGYTGIFRGSTALLVAPGGGGGGGGDNAAAAPTGGAGGAGGGSTGGAGSGGGGTVGGGGGGTQTAGGAAGSGNTAETTPGGAGASLAGGAGGEPTSSPTGTVGAGGTNGGGAGGRAGSANGRAGAGAGGAGYFGGGGGTAANAADTSGAGGGGGSSYLTGSATSTQAGSGQTAGNVADPDYAANAGRGGNAGGVGASGAAGDTGRMVLRYEVPVAAAPQAEPLLVLAAVTDVPPRTGGQTSALRQAAGRDVALRRRRPRVPLPPVGR